ncbi:hypothetical protein [Thalassobellus suaedae]|uniref:Uncharacterized protein n=1 Tax=Thalassobellus suaedae TaxID=3074124 RepID=A0ABY9XVW2_9FLAO|nr:hypothetical protein RHP51_04670 [Flavobacteriaceae bacterium HL-DH14]
MKKSVVFLVLFVSMFAISCTPTSISDDNEQDIFQVSGKDEEPDPS